ncbi:hypothetical protein BDP27DRAFT_1303651 [Rhodocollybia butyracea]|uniref:PNPLA domain-containing protein n=1 Tax=Rhodocollybia butyracea TaxID=206335 RepID=A0A9P5P755_9AGAR|nr:hypothetical protein BDP27DRAFT_1303651 [Rhodocollybia butyracea]
MWGTILSGERFSSSEFEALLFRVVHKYTGDAMALLKQPKSKPDPVEHRSTATFVTVVPAGAGSSGVEAYRLRSYATPRGAVESLPGYSWKIVEAARTTSAAPMYFAPVLVNTQVFQDAGGSGFNNPTSEAIKKLKCSGAGKSKDEVELVVLSLGTGLASLTVEHFDDQRFENPDDSRLKNVVNKLRSKVKNIATAKERLEQIAKQFVQVATVTERTHDDVSKRFLEWGRRDDYFRFNPPQGLGDLDLADYMKEGLIVEITNVWLRSPAGQDATMELYEKLREPYEAKKM